MKSSMQQNYQDYSVQRFKLSTSYTMLKIALGCSFFAYAPIVYAQTSITEKALLMTQKDLEKISQNTIVSQSKDVTTAIEKLDFTDTKPQQKVSLPIHEKQQTQQKPQNVQLDVRDAPLKTVSDTAVQNFYKDFTGANPRQNNFCPGYWVIPEQLESISQNLTSKANKETVYALADTVLMDTKENLDFSGDVALVYNNNTLHADSISYNKAKQTLKANSQVLFKTADLVGVTDKLTIKDISTDTSNSNKNTQAVMSMNNNILFKEKGQQHTLARSIDVKDELRTLYDVGYSTCAPSINGARQAWKLNAEKLIINQKTGRATSYNSTLNIAGIPVMYVPYMNFQYDKKRATGFLSPKFGFTNTGGLFVNTPFYINLAPNYDATITHSFLKERGHLISGDFRYLSSLSKLNAKMDYIHKDLVTNNKRYATSINLDTKKDNIRLESYFNSVSDKDYHKDYEVNARVRNELHVPRGIKASYISDDKKITSSILAETYQEMQSDQADKQKPYQKLPHIIYDYKDTLKVSNSTQATIEYSANTGFFRKKITDSSSVEDDGFRLFNELSTGLKFNSSNASVKPTIKVKHIFTKSKKDNNVSDEMISNSVLQPEFNLDLTLRYNKFINQEKSSAKHQVSPHIFYVFAPYKNQRGLPNYVTYERAQGFQNIFSNNRFIGGDRLADAHAISTGINYKYFDADNKQRFAIGLANKVNFNSFETKLNGQKGAVEKNSGILLQSSAQLTDNISFQGEAGFKDFGSASFHIANLQLKPNVNTVFNVGIDSRSALNENQKASKHVTTSFALPILQEQLQLFGFNKYNMINKKSEELLLGLSYASCCYDISAYTKNTYSNDRTNKTVMIEFSLKGLGSTSSKLNNLVKNKIVGSNGIN